MAARVFLWSVCGSVPSLEVPVNHVYREGLLNRREAHAGLPGRPGCRSRDYRQQKALLIDWLIFLMFLRHMAACQCQA